jgi:serine/threonine-protein kinase
VESNPPGAHVLIDGIGRGATPIELDDLEPGDHQLLLTAEGYVPEQRRVAVRAAAEHVTLLLSLAREPAAPDAGTARVEAVRPPRALGKLNLATTPWTSVYLGARKLGDTPLVGVPLPAGKHVLTLVNPEQNLIRTVEVEISPGELAVKRFSLQ